MTGAAERLDARWLGRVGYRRAWELQERLRNAIVDGRAAETILFLEHPPVITLGRAADRANVLLDDAALAARGIERVESSRGGDVTWHGPGQLVAYPVVRLARGVLFHVEAMARAVIAVAAGLGVHGEWRRECPGVWVGDRKLCAFGVHVSRRVAIHGLAFNVTAAEESFATIVPCGLRGVGVTSLAAAGGATPPLLEVARLLAAALGDALGREVAPLARSSSEELESLLSEDRSVK